MIIFNWIISSFSLIQHLNRPNAVSLTDFIEQFSFRSDNHTSFRLSSPNKSILCSVGVADSIIWCLAWSSKDVIRSFSQLMITWIISSILFSSSTSTYFKEDPMVFTCSWMLVWLDHKINSRSSLGPFHTERAPPAPALMRGPSQTNFYCFQRSLSHGADPGHRPRAGDMQRGLPLGWSWARAREKVLCNIASNGCLHTEREKPALADSFNDTQWKLVIKTGDEK